MFAKRTSMIRRSQSILGKRAFATPAFYQVPSEYQSRTPPYQTLVSKLSKVKRILNNQPLTYAEKILYSHLVDPESTFNSIKNSNQVRGLEYLKLSPDRVAMQDASAQMALLQFMTCGMNETAVPASIHCDHLIVGKDGAKDDLKKSIATNLEVFEFLKSCASKYGIQFWGPGSGIIHQIVLENFSAPGLMMLGTDSHTPNAGGLGAIAIGVGGADAVDALTGTPWELKAPKIMGVHLTGKLTGWSSPKDVITHLAGILSVRGGTGYIVEYFGEGVSTLSCTGMATICNMGAEIGATTSTFPFQEVAHYNYLKATNRQPIADAALQVNKQFSLLKADHGCEYDKVIEIDLSTLEPSVNGPFTPDLSTKISEFGAACKANNWPEKISVGLIGSCTNSSYQDMSRAADLVRQASNAGLKPKIPFFITPGSEQIRATLEKDGIIDLFEKNGGIVLANACGPCIGQWDRSDTKNDCKTVNSIFSSFNRNFKARNDGNRNTMNFLTSPEMVTAMIYSGNANFNPINDKVDGTGFQFKPPPSGYDLPANGFVKGEKSYYPETNPLPQPSVQVEVSPESSRLQLLEPFKPWNGRELETTVLLKVEGKCTTDHISAAGAWLKYKGHLENISNNTLIGALNKETGEVNKAYDLDGKQFSIPDLMIKWKAEDRNWVVVAEHNYGEGSAREHAALSPRFLGGQIILVKSFARIHETNLKKQGMLPLTFANESDYDRLSNGDILKTLNLCDLIKNNDGSSNTGIVKILVTKKDGSQFEINTKHTMSEDQFEFFKAGSAINYIGNLKKLQK